MRNKSCPIVTFQTERKWEFHCGRWPLRSMSRRPSGRLLLVNLAAPQHGKPEVKTLRVRLCGAAGELIPRRRKGNFPERVSKLRHSCNRFRRLWNWGLIALEVRSSFSYLIGAEGTRSKKLWGAPRA